MANISRESIAGERAIVASSSVAARLVKEPVGIIPKRVLSLSFRSERCVVAVSFESVGYRGLGNLCAVSVYAPEV